MESTQSQQVNLFNQIFNSQQIDVLGSVDNPVFITNQICKAIGQDTDASWIKQIKKNYQGRQQLPPQEIPLYKGQALSTITFRGVVEIYSRSQSAQAVKFRDFITELLFNLFRGKIQILVLDKELLEQQNKEYLTRLALTAQSNQELEEKLSQSMQSLADLTDAIQPVLEKERVQKTSLKKYWPCLAICTTEFEDTYQVYRLQYYQMNSKLRKLANMDEDMEVVLRLDNVPNEKTLWQICFNYMVEEGIIDKENSKLLEFQILCSEAEMSDFVETFYEQRKNIL